MRDLRSWIRSSHQEVFLKKVDLKICIKFTGEHPCRSVISIKLLCNFIEITLLHVCSPVNLCSFIEITLLHGCSPVNLLHIFRTSFTKNTSGRLLLVNPLQLLSLDFHNHWFPSTSIKSFLRLHSCRNFVDSFFLVSYFFLFTPDSRQLNFCSASLATTLL